MLTMDCNTWTKNLDEENFLQKYLAIKDNFLKYNGLKNVFKVMYV